MYLRRDKSSIHVQCNSGEVNLLYLRQWSIEKMVAGCESRDTRQIQAIYVCKIVQEDVNYIKTTVNLGVCVCLCVCVCVCV